VYIAQFASDYNLQFPCRHSIVGADERDEEDNDTDSAASYNYMREDRDCGCYLMISQEWVTFKALEQHGMKYRVAAQSFIYLEPTLTWVRKRVTSCPLLELLTLRLSPISSCYSSSAGFYAT
jgi:hypothetical protein